MPLGTLWDTTGDSTGHLSFEIMGSFARKTMGHQWVYYGTPFRNLWDTIGDDCTSLGPLWNINIGMMEYHYRNIMVYIDRHTIRHCWGHYGTPLETPLRTPWASLGILWAAVRYTEEHH